MFSCYYKRRAVVDIPISKTHGVFIGEVALKGEARTRSPLTSYLTESECVYYSWSITESWRRESWEYYTDSEGKRQRRRKVETGWETVASECGRQWFELHDEHGSIFVDPAQSDITGMVVMDTTIGPSHTMYYGKGPSSSVSNSTHRRCFTERIIPRNQEVYVYGYACLPEDADRPVIAHSPDATMYLITCSDKKDVAFNFGCGFVGMLIFGGLVAGLPLFISLYNGFTLEECPAGKLFLGFYLTVSVICWFYVVYTSLIMVKNRVAQGLSNLDVELKRRHDLIPNLVRAVSGMKDHELGTQTLLAELRAEHYHSGDVQRELGDGESAGMAVHPLTPALMAVVERYPELTANDNFVRLQRELQNTENRIALARAYYNDIATNYNTRLEVFPDALVAVLCRLKKYRLLNE